MEYISSGTELELWQNNVEGSFVVTFDRSNGKRTLWSLQYPDGSSGSEDASSALPSGEKKDGEEVEWLMCCGTELCGLCVRGVRG